MKAMPWTVECALCGSERGEPCRTRQDTTSTQYHSVRIRAANARAAALLARGVGVTVKWETVDDTVWPCDVDGETQWQLRYGPNRDVTVASILSAYAHLTDPNLPQYAAVAALKRARRATKAALGGVPAAARCPKCKSPKRDVTWNDCVDDAPDQWHSVPAAAPSPQNENPAWHDGETPTE